MSNITLLQTDIIFPKGQDTLYLLLGLILIPYTLGALFVFIYIAHGDKTLFLSLNLENFFLFCWAIGYEIISCFALLYFSIQQLFFPKKLYEKNAPEIF